MADMISLRDGSLEVIFDLGDFMELTEEYMGFEAARWLREYLSRYEEYDEYITDLEDDMSRLRDRRHEVMEKLREQSEIIAGLLEKKTLNRKALSDAAGKIGMITWRELNL